MENFINEKISQMNSTDSVFQFLLDILDYKNASNFSLKENGTYDAEYSLNINHHNNTIVGIKIIQENNEELISKQHLKYWNQNEVPFSILILPDEIRIYNNFTISDKMMLYSSNQSDDYILKLFSDKNIISGLLWSKLRSILKKNERVDTYLLNNLRNTIIDLYQNYGMELEDAYNFLAQCIFIKYMEDREMLTESAFYEYGVSSLNELLQLEEINLIKSFFLKLKEWFNGDLFELENMNWPTREQLNVIKSFFEADEIYTNGTVQITLYKYDFSQIPIELISNIYETFFNLGDKLLDKDYSSKNGAYYTPYYLADFMNDRCLEEYNGSNKAPVVMDPACGSGVFLVGAFKKIVNCKRTKQERISQEDLRKVLSDSIYGVDTNLKALRLTCFSLYIALLEYLDPKDILKNEFTFPNLIGKTLFCCNFFSDELDSKGIAADIIVGNPPWVSDRAGEHNIYCRQRNIPISDGQIAQAFVARVKDFSKEETIVSLIVTNSIFTNENADAFRKYILKNYYIKEVFNLSRVRKSLFSHASAPCSILTYGCTTKEAGYSFQYYAFRPNMLSGIFNKIVYDKQEIITIKSTIVMKKDYIWRVLNSGDEYDVRVISKIKSNPLIKDRGYQYFRGYAVGSKEPKPRPEFLKYKGGNLQEGYGKYLINYNVLPQMTEQEFERPRKLEGYLCKNKLLIKRTQNNRLSGAAFCEKPIIFTDDYHCIYDVSGTRRDDLKILEAFINSRIFTYYRFFASKAANAIKPEISKDDLLSFPIPENIKTNCQIEIINKIEKIEELLREKFGKQLFEEYAKAEIDQKIEELQENIDQLVLRAYNLDEVEQATIDYALNYVIPLNTESSLLIESKCDVEIYEAYSEYVEQYFNKFLQESNFRLKRFHKYSQNLYTLISFKIENLSTDEESGFISEDFLMKNIVDILGLSGIENIDSELIVKNRISGFLDNGFFVIKEQEIKNWTLMNAIKDAEYFAKNILSESEEDLYE